MRTTARCSWLFLFAVLSGAPARAGDWPGWRGPTGQGLSDAVDLPLVWGGNDNRNILWKSPLAPGDKIRLDHNQSSPIVWGDRVFVVMVWWPEGAAPAAMPEHHVLCYSVLDGRRLWDTAVKPGPWLLSDLRGGYAAPTPAADGKRVYVLFGSAVLAALDFDGKILWRAEIVPHQFDVAMSASPVLSRSSAGDNVLVLCDQADPGKSRLAAFDRATGALRWEKKRPGTRFSHSTPVLVPVDGKQQLLVSSADAVQGLDPEDGRVVWWCSNPGDVASPILGNGLVFALSGRGGPMAAVSPTGSGDVTRTLVKWKSPAIPEDYGSPVAVGEYVYYAHRGAILRCWRAGTGEVVYTERLPDRVVTAASPVATADGRLYFASGGRSVVVKVGPKFQVLGTSDLNDPGSASPAVAGGRLYLKGGRFLYCVGRTGG